MSFLLPALVLIPLAGGAGAYLGGRKVHRVVAFIVSLGTLVAAAALAAVLWHDGPIRYEIGGWEAPIGISLYADGLSAFLLIMTAAVGALVSLFATAFYGTFITVTSIHEDRLFWPLWLFLWSALNGLFLGADLFNLYVVFELMGLAAIALITLAGKPAALKAAMRYLVAAFLGSLSYLMGVALIYAEYGVLDLLMLGDVLLDTPGTLIAFALIATGLVLKTALFPMHFWLPPAHASASAPVSAVLSALVVKGSFFVLVRLWFNVFYGTLSLPAGTMLGVLGSAAILWGSFQALRQRRLKLLIAHSTVSQVGYLFLLFPLTAVTAATLEGGAPTWLSEAWTGVTYHALSHALAKSSMFLAAGSIAYAYGSDRLGASRGLYRSLPLTTFAIAVAGTSLIGLPPSAGFVAKWFIMKAAIGSGQWWWLPFIVLGGLLTAGYMTLILRYSLAAAEPPRVQRKVRRRMEVAALVLAILSIITGFRLEEPFRLLLIGTPFGVEEVMGSGF